MCVFKDLEANGNDLTRFEFSLLSMYDVKVI